MSPAEENNTKNPPPRRTAECVRTFPRSEINIINGGISELKLFLGYSLKRRIYEFLAGIIGFHITHLRALDLIALAGDTQLAVFAGGLDIVAEQLFLCHKYSSSRKMSSFEPRKASEKLRTAPRPDIS